MKVSIFKSLCLIVAIGLSLASASFGQQTLGLTNSGATSDNKSQTVTIDGKDTAASPYGMSLGGTVAGNYLNGAQIAMFCDDAIDDIVTGQAWYVASTALSTITSSSTSVDTVYYVSDPSVVTYGNAALGAGDAKPETLTQAEKYVAAVDLAVELTISPTNANIQAYSIALWDVFNPGTVNSSLTIGANADLLSAISFAQSYNYITGGPIDGYTATIYTPVRSANGSYNLNGSPKETLGSGVAAPPGGGRPQEFIELTSVPEPSTWAVLGFDLVGAGIVGLYFRRRKSRIQS